jgi:hypothetical protein
MKPIAQTFYVNEPAAGVPGIFITKVDIYFKSVSSSYGIELQIRTTDNGAPTLERLPFASAIKTPSDTYPPLASDNASLATTFEFETPVFVESGKSYALVLLPVGGNPDYKVWTAEIGQRDSLSNTPIYTNNDTGDLYLSSNDRSWLPVITEDWKFTIYRASFTANSGTAIFHSPDEEYLKLSDIVGTPFPGEPIVVTDNSYDNAWLDITGLSGSISTGNYIYQTDDGTPSGTNTAVGIVYSTNSSVLKVTNTTGVFGACTVYNANASGNAVVTGIYQNAVTVSSNTTITVPDSSIFGVGNVIYVTTSGGTNAQVVSITDIPYSNQIVVNTAIAFSDGSAIYGKVLYNGTLTGSISEYITERDGYTYMIIDMSTATTGNNFTAAVGKKIIGEFSGATAKIVELGSPPYNQISPSFVHVTPANTDISWSIKGVANDSIYTPDSTYLAVREGISNEFIDKERTLLSRSNELVNLPVGRKGDRTLRIKADMSASNNKISPSIDFLSKLTHFTYNWIIKDVDLYGFYTFLSNTSGTFANGEIVTQGSTSGTVCFANSTFLRLGGVSGGTVFAANSTQVTGLTSGATATIDSSTFYGENIDNGPGEASRYISKTVILASSQNSEDMIAYLGAYRPDKTNLRVYTKIINDADPDLFDTKDWSFLRETSPTSLLSSSVNADDQVELVYGFPQSINLFISNTYCNTTSNNVTVFSTAGLQAGQYIYMSNADNKQFNVRQVISVVNSSTVTVDKTPSFVANSSTGNTAFGYIPGLASPTGAFLNDQNSNIAYDTYSQFAIKIVPTAESRALVPRVSDMRVLAVQA